MALYRVEAPNGNTYEVTAPSGTKMEDIYEYVQVEFLSKEQDDSTTPTPTTGLTDTSNTPTPTTGLTDTSNTPTPTTGLTDTSNTPTSGFTGTTPTTGLTATSNTPTPTTGLAPTADSTVKDPTSIIPETDYSFDDGTPMFLTDGGMGTSSWAEEANKIQGQIDAGETEDYAGRPLVDRLKFAKSKMPEEAFFSEEPSFASKAEAVAKNFASGSVTNQSMMTKGVELNLLQTDLEKLLTLRALRSNGGEDGKPFMYNPADNGLKSLVTPEYIDAEIARLEEKTGNSSEYFALSNSIKEYKPDTTKLDPRTDNFWLKDVPEAGGQAVTFMANQFLINLATKGRGGKVANFGGIAAQGSLVNSTASFEDALNHDASLEDAFTASDIGALIGTTEAMPLASMLNRIDKGTGGSIRFTLRKMLSEGTEEALQEAVQTIMNNISASDLVKYDPERKMLVDVEHGAEVGFTVGSILSVVTSLYSGRKMRKVSNQINEDVGNKDVTGAIEKGVIDVLDPNASADAVDPSQPAIDSRADAHLNPVVVDTEINGEQPTAVPMDDKRFELRNKHAKTFPNEKDWVKANREVVFNQQKADVNDPNTEIGKQFLSWKNDPEVVAPGMHDTNEEGAPTDEAFKLFLKDNVVKPNTADEHAAYVTALDAHALEQEANPTPQVLEPTVETTEETLAETQGETNENAEAFPSNPFIGTKKKVRKASWDKAAEALGENFEETHAGLSQLINNDKRYSSKGFDKAIADAVKSQAEEASSIEETNEVTPTTGETEISITGETGVATTGEESNDLVQRALNTAAINWNPTGRSKNRPKLVKWFSSVLQDGTLGDFIDKKGDFMNSEVVKAAGLNKSDDVTYNKKTIAKILAESYGYKDTDSFLKDYREYLSAKYPSSDTSLERATTSASNLVSLEDDADSGVLSPRKLIEGEVDQSKTVTAGGSKGEIFTLSKEEETWVDKKASAEERASVKKLETHRKRGDKLRQNNASAEEWASFNKELNDLVVQHPELKQVVVSELKLSARRDSVINNKAEKKIASTLWGEHQNEEGINYDGLSDGAKYDWHLSIDEYAQTKNETQLQKDLQEIENTTYPTLLGEPNAQTKQKRPTESAKETKGLGKSSTGSQGSGNTAVANNGKDAPKPRAKKYTKKQQAAVAYAEKHLGRDWETDRKRLVPLLKKRDLKGFYAFVDKVAGVDVKVAAVAAKKEFESRDAAEKAAPVNTTKKAKLNKTEARKYARSVLGKYWKRDNPDLVSMVSSTGFDALPFQRRINEIVDSKPNESKPQFAFRDGVQRENNSPYKVTHGDVEGFVAELMGRDKATSRDMRRIHIFQSHAELSAAIVDGNMLGETVAKEEIESITKKGAYIHGNGVAFVRLNNGVKHAFFILDEMDMASDQMSVAGIFVHEVGVHMGMQSLMGGKATSKVANTIRSWASRNDGSIEQQVALEVEARIDYIQETHKARGEALMTQAEVDSETVAYAVQFGVQNHGINPIASKPGPKGSLRSIIKTAYNTLKNFMDSLTGGNAKSITIENLVDAAYGAARLEINKTYHVSTTEKIGDVDLTHAGSGLDGAVNGFGFNIADRFGSAGVYAKEISKGATKPVKLNSLLNLSKKDAVKSVTPGLTKKLEKLTKEGTYLLGGNKWKPLAWGGFEFTYTKGGEGGHTVTVTHIKSGDSMDVALELRDENGARMFSTEEVATLGTMVDHLSGSPQVYTHMVDVLVTDEELMSLDDRISEQKIVVDFVNSMSKELQALIVSENDEGASLEEMSGRALYETLFLIEAGHTKKGSKGYQLINELADTHKVTHDDLKVANQIEGEMRHSAKIAAIMDRAGIKGTKTVDVTEPGGLPSELDALSDSSLGAVFKRKARATQGSIADEEGSSRDSKILEGTYNKVIFNEDNIITSGTIRMTDSGGKLLDIPLSKKKDYVRFSIKNERNHNDRRNIRRVVKFVGGKNAAYQWDTLASFAKKSAESLDFLSSLIYKHRFELPAAVDVEKVLRDKDVMRNKIVRSVESVAVQAREMTFERRQLVNSFIQKATTEQLWPADPNIDGRTVTVDKDFHKEFTEVLSDSEQKVVIDVFKHGHDMATMLKDLSVELGIDSEFLGFTQMEGPYAPLMRFGDYIVEHKSKEVVDIEAQIKKGGLPPYKEKLLSKKLESLKTNDKYYEISFHQTEGEANKHKDAKASKYATSTVSPKGESVSDGRVPDVKVLEKVYGAMKTLDLDPGAKKAFESMLEDMYHSALEDANARHSQTRRKGYAGYNDNMLFNFIEHAKAEANLAATLKYGKDINVTLAEMTAQAKESKNPNVMKLNNAVIKHYTSTLAKGETRIADAILSYNAFSLLTSSFGYHVQNATQTFAVAHPILAGTFGGWNNVRTKIMNGYHVAGDIVGYDGKVPFTGGKKVTWQTVIDVDAAPAKYRHVLSRIQNMGQLDVGVEEDLSSLKETSTGFKAFDATSRGAATISHRAYQVPRLVESYNRVSTAIAAFDLATENPEAIKHMRLTPEEFAVKVVQDAQGDFSSTGAPYFFKTVGKNPVGKVALQFRKFSVMMMWAYARATFQAFKGVTKQEKIIGARTVAFLLMHTAVFSGVRGLPAIAKFTAIYLLLAGMFGEDDEEPKDTKGYIERMVDENVDNKTVATMINRGVLSALGIDASIKLSHAGIFDLVPFGDFDLSLDGLWEYVYGAFGPTGGQAANVVRGFEFAKEDNYYRALESVSPKVLKSPMESYRLGTEGYTDSAGTVVANPDNFDMLPLIANALGIPVSQVSNLKWNRGEQYEIKEYFTRRQQEITSEHKRASKAKDQKARRNAEGAWYKLQAAKDNIRPFFNNAPNSLKRTPITVLFKAGDRDWKKQQKLESELGTR